MNHIIKALSKKIFLLAGMILLCDVCMVSAGALNRFVKNDDNTITDTKTGLMWAAKDNGSPINWHNALFYCRDFKGGGYTDWQMPTLDELASIYDSEEKNKNGYHINKLIETTASTCWAADTRDNLAGRYNFKYGEVYWLRKSYSGPTRVLPVRKVK
ncbi:MAG: DUF1566 domain-containing protein [Desulfobacterales bacterium]|nr:DUF1566 domain-containing protein [Desulfobacterales bacterium]